MHLCGLHLRRVALLCRPNCCRKHRRPALLHLCGLHLRRVALLCRPNCCRKHRRPTLLHTVAHRSPHGTLVWMHADCHANAVVLFTVSPSVQQYLCAAGKYTSGPGQRECSLCFPGCVWGIVQGRDGRGGILRHAYTVVQHSPYASPGICMHDPCDYKCVCGGGGEACGMFWTLRGHAQGWGLHFAVVAEPTFTCIAPSPTLLPLSCACVAPVRMFRVLCPFPVPLCDAGQVVLGQRRHCVPAVRYGSLLHLGCSILHRLPCRHLLPRGCLSVHIMQVWRAPAIMCSMCLWQS